MLCPSVEEGRGLYICYLLLKCTILHDVFSGIVFILNPPFCDLGYADSVCLCGGGGGWVLNPVSCWRPYAAGLLQSVSDQIYILQNCFSTPRKKPRRLGGFKPVLGSLTFKCGSGSRSVNPWIRTSD